MLRRQSKPTGAAVFVWDIDPNFFHLPDFLGGRGIRYYGVLYAITLMGGFYIWQWQMRRGNYPQKQIDGFLTLAVVAIIGGARLGHCLFYEPERYLSDPIRILYFWEGGLASHGATIALIAALIWHARRNGMAIREVLDRFAICASFGATMVRIGNFMNSEIVGRISDGPLKVKFPRYEFLHLGTKPVPCDLPCAEVQSSLCGVINGQCWSYANVAWRHPSQLYEVFLGVTVFVVLFLLDRKFKEDRPLGMLGFAFIALYFTGRFVVEYFKEFQSLSADASAFTMGQYLSIPFIIIGSVGLFYSFKKNAEKSAGKAA